MSLRDRLDSVFKGQEEINLTEGGIAKPLFYLSLPIVVTNLLQTAYNLADTFWLGQYGTEELAAISFAFPMVFLLIALGMGLSVAGSVLVAQNTGAGEDKKAEYAASQTVTFSLLAALILGGIGFLSVDQFLGLLGASPDVLPLATSYMRVISLGLVFMFGFFVFISLMRGYGDTITPMLVMFGSVALNIVLDPILIFGFSENPLFGILGLQGLQSNLFAATAYAGNGIEGAAYATVFSRALALVVGLYIMFNGSRGVQIRLSEMKPDFSYARKLLSIGIPASIEGTGRALSVNLLLVIVSLFPTTVVAGYGIGVRVFSVVFLPAIAVARGVETMTGQNIGAGKPDRASGAANFAAKVMFVVLSLLGVVAFVAAEPIIALFTTDAAVVSAGASFLRWVAPTFGFIGIMRAYTGSFRGAGKTMVAAAVAITMLGFIRLPVAWLGAQQLGENGVWLAFSVSNAAGALIAYTWYRRGTWRDADVTRGPDGDVAPATDD